MASHASRPGAYPAATGAWQSMTAAAQSSQSWERFAAALAEITQLPLDAVNPGSRLIEDLGLDSLALVELVVFAIETYNPATVSKELDARQWEGVTAGEFFGECAPGQLTPA